MEQYKKRVNMYMMPLFCILLSRRLELVINDPLGLCVFSSPCVKSPLDPCKLLPTASRGQELHCLATLCKGPSPVYFKHTFCYFCLMYPGSCNVKCNEQMLLFSLSKAAMIL